MDVLRVKSASREPINIERKRGAVLQKLWKSFKFNITCVSPENFLNLFLEYVTSGRWSAVEHAFHSSGHPSPFKLSWFWMLSYRQRIRVAAYFRGKLTWTMWDATNFTSQLWVKYGLNSLSMDTNVLQFFVFWNIAFSNVQNCQTWIWKLLQVCCENLI